MSTSRFGAVVDALVALADATSVETVFDGPPLTSDAPTEYLIVGGTDDEDDDAGEFTQEPSAMGNHWLDETGEVTCAVLVGTGDEDVKTTRDRALVIRGEIETLIRADPTLGGVLTAPATAYIASSRPRQRRNANGLYVRIVLTVRYSTLLT